MPVDAAQAFRAAITSIFGLSKLKVVAEGDATYRMSASVVVEQLRDGGRPVQVRANLLDPVTGRQIYTTEFKTTLSEPVDAEQWKTIGEAVAYRLTAPLRKQRFATPGKLSGGALSIAEKGPENIPALSKADEADMPEGPLVLKLDLELHGPQIVGDLGIRIRNVGDAQ